MDDTAVVWTLPGVLGLIAAVLVVLAVIIVAGWLIRCPQGTTACDCSGDYPRQCNYQCYKAEPCTCKDRDSIKTAMSNIRNYVDGKKTEGSGSGSSGSSGGSGGSRDWTAGGQVGGLTDDGEIWIDKSVMDQYCQEVVDSVYQHELVHKGDDKCQDPINFISWTLQGAFDSSAPQRLHDRSEFSAYAAQTQYLDSLLASLEAKCNAVYRCSYSGEIFDDRFDCIHTCRCSLLHPCAGRPPCIEQDRDSGKPTGNRY